MAEAAGLALGVAGLLVAFKGAVEGYQMLRDALGDGDDAAWLRITYQTDIDVIETWGAMYMREDESGITHLQFSPVLRPAVQTILESMQVMQAEADRYLQKHGAKMPRKRDGRARIKWQARKFRWVFTDKEKAEEYVNRVKYLTTRLMEVTNLPSGFILHQAARQEASRSVDVGAGIEDVGDDMIQRTRKVKEELRHGNDTVEDLEVVLKHSLLQQRCLDKSGFRRRLMQDCLYAAIDDTALDAIESWWAEHQSSMHWIQGPVEPDDYDTSIIHAGASFMADVPKAVYCCDWTWDETPDAVIGLLLDSLIYQLVTDVRSVTKGTDELQETPFPMLEAGTEHHDQALNTLEKLIQTKPKQQRLFLAIDGVKDPCENHENDSLLWKRLIIVLNASCKENQGGPIIKILFTTKGYNSHLEATVPENCRTNIMGTPRVRSPLLPRLARLFCDS